MTPKTPQPSRRAAGKESNAPSKLSDQLGTAAAFLCAIHCLAAPLILAVAPVLGAFWSDPKSHWLFASVSLPAAALLLRKGLRVHQHRGVLALAVAGMTAVLIGLAAPGTKWASGLSIQAPAPAWLVELTSGRDEDVADDVEVACTDEGCTDEGCTDSDCAGESAAAEEACTDECCAGEEEAGEECTDDACADDTCADAECTDCDDAVASDSVGCQDECCASIQHGENGSTVTLPFASIITMLGGLALVAAHIANIRLCCGSGRCAS